MQVISKRLEKLIAYWRFNEPGNRIVADYSQNPTNIDLLNYMEGKSYWQYVDEPFPILASYSQISTSDIFGSPLEPISNCRVLYGNNPLELTDFTVSEEQTLEFWVTS